MSVSASQGGICSISVAEPTVLPWHFTVGLGGMPENASVPEQIDEELR
jgi:hypothetical protein